MSKANTPLILECPVSGVVYCVPVACCQVESMDEQVLSKCAFMVRICRCQNRGRKCFHVVLFNSGASNLSGCHWEMESL